MLLLVSKIEKRVITDGSKLENNLRTLKNNQTSQILKAFADSQYFAH